jgi:hypothetical protein
MLTHSYEDCFNTAFTRVEAAHTLNRSRKVKACRQGKCVFYSVTRSPFVTPFQIKIKRGLPIKMGAALETGNVKCKNP